MAGRGPRRCLLGCPSTQTILFRFPSGAGIRAAWLEFLHFDESGLSARSRVCARHFTQSCFSNYGQYSAGLAKDLILTDTAVPTVYTVGAPSSKAPTRDVGCQCQDRPRLRDAFTQTGKSPIPQTRPYTWNEGQPAYEMLESHPDWKPSLHLGRNKVKATDKERFVRRVRRRGATTLQKAENSDLQEVEVQAQEEEQEMTAHMIEVVVEEEEEVEVMHEDTDEPQTSDEESTEETFLDSYMEDDIMKENKRLKSELAEFKMTEQFLKDDDEKVKYYTGLPSYATFQVLLCYIVPFLPHEETELTHFQTVLLTFMSLKLDLPMEHISHLFNVHPQTARAAFNGTVSVLYARLSLLVRWPDRERLSVSMPHQFVETFGEHLAVIVNCIKVSIEKTVSLETTAQTPSTIEHSCTLKYLIGVTPQGVVSFISKGFDGRITDKEMTESCGFLDKLLPGDVVLAGQGFDIQEDVGMMCAEVKMPAFTQGPHQLDIMDVEKMRKMAHLRTHVERIIGLVHNTYKILSSSIPVCMVEPHKGENVPFIEKVVTVCCALSNVCPRSVLCAAPESKLWLKQS